jgi:hypothetical protein
MTKSSKEELINKWAPIIESMGVTGSKADWMSQYVETHSLNENTIGDDLIDIKPTDYNKPNDLPNLLPIDKRVFAQTIGLNLVSVKPIGGNSKEELDKIKNEVKTENRDRKIDAITDNKDFEEMSVDEHPEYGKGGPKAELFYMDYVYSGTSSKKTHKKTRRSKKKKKNEKS